MNLQILLNGKDISNELKLTDGILYDRLGGSMDNLKLLFPYDNGVAFNKFDELQIIADKYDTGVMCIMGCGGVSNNKYCHITAVSGKPTNRAKRSKIFANVTLYQIINTVATACNLGVKIYDIENFSYKSLCQTNETDLQFLNRICMREGYSVKVDNGNLVVFNDFSLETNYESITLKKADTSSSSFARSENGLKNVTVRYFDTDTKRLIAYTATDGDMDGGSETIIEKVTSTDEAERFAKGYLRQHNKMALTGNISMSFNTDISAGTTLELEGFNEYDCKYIVYEVRHDISNGITHLKIRKTLTY